WLHVPRKMAEKLTVPSTHSAIAPAG
ncbi:MAG: hypothetical protein QOF98_25, partial [Streptomyces sp.]|nr:hypothetical protein [Streptomyces sp.]